MCSEMVIVIIDDGISGTTPIFSLLREINMNENEVIEIAKAAIKEKGWSWTGPITVQKIRKYLLVGPHLWQVWTNSNAKSGNVVIYIDDATGKVLSINCNS